jgi:hypothetical protein
MINDGINDVPDKTIAIFTTSYPYNDPLTQERLLGMIKKPDKKRDWFSPHFYRCLPLTIGNQYGFVVSSEFDFSFEWNGGDQPEDTQIYLDEKIDNLDTIKYPNVQTHFGHGIVTINTPYFLRTPPGVNLITMNAPNYIIPNVTVMTGVVEADNLRKNFTFNLKIQIPNIKTTIPAGWPLAAFMPVPRYYCDEFNLDFAENLFDGDIVNEELKAENDAGQYRANVEINLKDRVGRHYMQGKDVYGNKFKDHQKP